MINWTTSTKSMFISKRDKALIQIFGS